MVSRFSLAGTITPEVDDRAAEREADDLAETFQSRLSDMDIAGAGGVGALGGARGDAGGGGAAGAAAAAGGLRGAAAAGGLAKVALGGVVGFGILKATQKLSDASPALSQTAGMLSDAMSLFFRPFGNFLSGVLRPFAAAGLNMAVRFNELADEEGLAVAVGKIGAEAVTSLATGMASAIEDLATGEGTLADFLFAGAGAVALTKLVSSVSLTSLVTSSSASSLFTTSAASAVLTGVSATALISAASITAFVTGTIAIDQYIAGQVDASDILDIPGGGTQQPDEDVTPEDIPTVETPFGTINRERLNALGFTVDDLPTFPDIEGRELPPDVLRSNRQQVRDELQDVGVSDVSDERLNQFIRQNRGEALGLEPGFQSEIVELAREIRADRQQQADDADNQDVVDSIDRLRRELQGDVGGLLPTDAPLPSPDSASDQYDPF